MIGLTAEPKEGSPSRPPTGPAPRLRPRGLPDERTREGAPAGGTAARSGGTAHRDAPRSVRPPPLYGGGAGPGRPARGTGGTPARSRPSRPGRADGTGARASRWQRLDSNQHERVMSPTAYH
jgi:hypothetical protein